jgi:acyl-CoA thioesterase-1
MKLYLAIAALLLVTGCGSEQAPAPAPSASAEAAADLPVIGPERRVLAFGDSLFAGYGLQDGEGYPERLEAALRARGINARIANAAVSGDTTAAARQRFVFALNSQPAPPQLVIICLGGNDMLRALPADETRANLEAMLAELDSRGIPALVMSMLSPPNLGADYRGKFDTIYPALAKQHDAALVPFFLQSVIGRPELIQADHLHPTAAGIETIVAATLDQVAAALEKVK